ncbi:MAG: hypothetical protein ACI8W8_000490 [Rhodothermales bacterium]|jgi:hypothetical protein
MIVGSYLDSQETNRRELMMALGFAIDEGRPFDVALEPLAKGRMSELSWILMFAFGPAFLLVFRSRWQNELFRFRLGRVIDCLREGEPLPQAISRHLKWWVPRHHRAALATDYPIGCASSATASIWPSEKPRTPQSSVSFPSSTIRDGSTTPPTQSTARRVPDWPRSFSRKAFY